MNSPKNFTGEPAACTYAHLLKHTSGTRGSAGYSDSLTQTFLRRAVRNLKGLPPGRKSELFQLLLEYTLGVYKYYCFIESEKSLIDVLTEGYHLDNLQILQLLSSVRQRKQAIDNFREKDYKKWAFIVFNDLGGPSAWLRGA